MTFHPRMESMVEGLTVVGDLRVRFFDGAVADLWDVECGPHAHGEYVSHAPRLVVVLDQRGTGGMDVTTSPNRSRQTASQPHPLFYVPAGLRVWSRIDNLTALRHLDLHFDLRALAGRLEDDLDPGAIDVPRLMFADPRILSLAKLIAEEFERAENLHDLYGDSLISALFVALLKIERKFTQPRGQLAPHQLRKTVDYIEDNFAANIRLEELAALTGLSPAYFCHAFKQTTGMPPHRWQMQTRVNRAKQLLEGREATVSAIAAATGFSDQAHLTRVFRQFVGTTPHVWRKSRLG